MASQAIGSILAQVAGVFRAASFANWSMEISQGPVPAGSPATFNLVTGGATLQDGTDIIPFTVGAPITIGLGSTQETVNVAAFSQVSFSAGYGVPTVSATTSHSHGQGEKIVSGSGGLCEACAYAASVGGGTVVLDGAWRGTAGNVTLAAELFPTVSIQDNRSGSGGGQVIKPTLDVASQPTYRALDIEPTLAFQGSTTISGSVAGLRSNITQLNGNTIAGGFEYGVQGKLTLAGTLNNGSGFNAGVFGQTDTSAASFVHTSGYLSPLMGDFGATSIMASDANANMCTLLNTTNCIINSALFFYGNAAYAMDLTDAAYGGAHFVVGTTASTAAGCLKVHINGNVRYLQLYSAEA